CLNLAVVITAYADKVFDLGVNGYSLLTSLNAIGALSGALMSAGRRRATRLRGLAVLLGVLGALVAAGGLMPNAVLYGAVLVGDAVRPERGQHRGADHLCPCRPRSGDGGLHAHPDGPAGDRRPDPRLRHRPRRPPRHPADRGNGRSLRGGRRCRRAGPAGRPAVGGAAG